LARRLAPDTLIVVDAVSSLGCVPIEMDPWDIDVVFTGSQKGWMTPPGLMMIAASPRAWEASKVARLPRFYFDWTSARKKVVLGGGQEHLDGKIFRVGHLGFFQEAELIEAMDAVQKRLHEFGFKR